MTTEIVLDQGIVSDNPDALDPIIRYMAERAYRIDPAIRAISARIDVRGDPCTSPGLTKVWCLDGLLHRVDGPAVRRPNGRTQWPHPMVGTRLPRLRGGAGATGPLQPPAVQPLAAVAPADLPVVGLWFQGCAMTYSTDEAYVLQRGAPDWFTEIGGRVDTVWADDRPGMCGLHSSCR